jgi:hypothetical protein
LTRVKKKINQSIKNHSTMSGDLEKEETKQMPSEVEAGDQPIEKPNLGCGILGRYPIISVVTGAAIGIGIGVGLSYWETDPETKRNTLMCKFTRCRFCF